MQWSMVKSWAKDRGYETFREKAVNKDNQYDYYWGKIDDPAVTGMSISVSKLATQIFNDVTNNVYIEYQEEYRVKQSQQDIDHNGLSGQW